jgi:uncharacterized membrane protein YqjE
VLNPALHLLATRPQWLAEHAEAYAELAAAEFSDAAGAARRALILGVLSLCLVLLALGLAGVSVMLWAVTPVLTERALWGLLATPAVPLVSALALLLMQQLASGSKPFNVLRQQLQADMKLLRQTGAA